MTTENKEKSEYYESLIHQARQTDLVDWLARNGVKLRQVGQWHEIEGHDSYRIQGNKWYRNSQDKGGNAIDFVCDYYGISPKQAIIRLTGIDLAERSKPIHKPKNDGVNEKKKKPEETARQFDFCTLELNNDQRRVIAYLTQKRGIDAAVVLEEIKGKRLFQEAKTGNAIFAMLDENGGIVGAETQGTMSYENARFKGIKTGSIYGYGYNTGERNKPRYTLYFESAVDLLSFITIKRGQSKTLTGCLMVSLGGLKTAILRNTFEVFSKSGAQPVFCVDNDNAGNKFIENNIILYPNAIIHQPDKNYKDWNDQLLDKMIEY